MNTIRQMRKAAVVVPAALLATMLWSAQAFAGGVGLTLVRSTLTNVTDTAGNWQHEGGIIQKPAGTPVGQYAITRRVTTGGTSAQNTAMTTVTLFFSAPVSAPPNNVTLQGAHSFSNGRFLGSVSAASNRHSWVQGADAVINPTATAGTSTLSIFWTGSNQLTLP